MLLAVHLFRMGHGAVFVVMKAEVLEPSLLAGGGAHIQVAQLQMGGGGRSAHFLADELELVQRNVLVLLAGEQQTQQQKRNKMKRVDLGFHKQKISALYCVTTE